MLAENIVSQINSLPDEIQSLAYDYINNLKINFVRFNEQSEKKKPFKDEEFFGIWKNNEKIIDSTAFVKNLRKFEFENV
ncbi:MAG TPA: hypothetical protein PK762_10690 [Candidatus Kapabacteria bacterium]|nr:hypothetical protein [Candidatus Kapabacteria bacterium]